MIYAGHLDLAADDPAWWDSIKDAFTKLMVYLHSKNNVVPEMINDDEPKKFISELTDIFNDAIEEKIHAEDLSDGLRSSMQDSNEVFSGEKTFHEMKEAFNYLFDKDGKLKPFDKFLSDVQTVNESYNKNYLRTEYNFAVNSGLMAAKWERFQDDGDDYYLQYRTAEDERVRLSHRPLDGITLPIDSDFWDNYFPPNGWGCRCTIVQVRKNKYDPSDEDDAISLGEDATDGKNDIFRFNPGKQGLTFPKNNAYTINMCKQCTKGRMNLLKDTNELCAICNLMHHDKR